MKYLMTILLLTLTACGSGGGSNSGSSAAVPGVDPSLPATCKNLYSVWQSDTDLEKHDFTTLANGSSNYDYGFIGSSGTTCGYASDPSKNVTAQITAMSGGAYQAQLALVASDAMTGVCALYTPPGSVGGRYSNALIITSTCDEIQICIPYGAGTCKTFH